MNKVVPITTNPNSCYRCPNKCTDTTLFYCSTKYGNWCEDALDGPVGNSDYERRTQCCYSCGFLLCLPFTPIMCLYDIISYPVRRLVKCFSKAK